MRQYCPHCSQVGEFADDLAGREAPCPNCKKPFTLRGSYTPGVAPGGGVPPTAPPGVPPVPEIAPPPGLKTEATPPIPVPSAHAGSFGISLNPLWLDFVPVGCLVLALVLSFFPWASLSLGGYSVMSQSGWESFAGLKSASSVPSGAEFSEWETLDQDLKGKDAEKKAGALGMDILIFPYLLLLIVAVAFAVLERLLRNPTAANLPAPLLWLPKFWHLRLLILGGFAAILLVLVGLAAFRGFGLERSVQKLAYMKHEKKLADNPTDTKIQQTWILIGQEAGKYPVHQTLWLKLLLWAHIIALLACAARIWLDKRGNQPNPRLGLQW